MNSTRLNTLVLRLLFTKSSFRQRSVSKFTKLDNFPASGGITFTKSFYRCCSNHNRNDIDNLEKPTAGDFETKSNSYDNIDTEAAKNGEESTAGDFEMNPTLYDDIDIEAITDNDPEKKAALEVLLIRLRTKTERGQLVNLPKKVNTRRWREIIALPTISQKMKYFKFLAATEVKKEEKKLLKLEKRKEYEKFKEEKDTQPKPILTTSSPPVYGLSNTSQFHRIRDKDIEKFYNYKLLDAIMYGPDIVFDCEYTSFMTRREINSAAFQVGSAWRMNRSNLKPFNIVYTNLSKGSHLYERIKLMYPLLDEDPGYPFIYTPKSFVDLYPKDKLIYLSPHAVETMETYESDKVYIIGCMVDIVMPEPLSLAKAKKLGIRTMKFPLNKYLNWKSGGKALNMDHCIKIMLDIKNGRDWQSTLVQHIPHRKLEATQPAEAKEIVNDRLDARAIKRMYFKNKVHELIVDEERKKFS